jgi:hypothetical protein
MSIVALLVIVGLVLLGTGFARGNAIALILGGVLLADAMAMYVIFGPAAELSRTLFGVK